MSTKNFLDTKKKHVDSLFLTDKKRFKRSFKRNKFLKKIEKNKFFKFSEAFSLNSMGSCYISTLELKSCIKYIKWGLKKFGLQGKVNFFNLIFPAFFLTSKPKEVRMGKGKGDNNFPVFFLKKGTKIFSFSLNEYSLQTVYLLKKFSFVCASKIPVKVKVFKFIW